MVIDREFIKKAVIFLSAVIFSLIFVFAGNRIASTGLTAFDNADASEAMKVEVLDLLDKNTSEYNLGGSENLQATKISFSAKVLSGELKGKTITASQVIDTLQGVLRKEVEPGDKILVSKVANNETGAYDWVAGDYVRTDMLIILGIVFVVLLILFGRMKGANTIISLVFTCSAVFAVFIPAVLSGKNIYFWSIIVCAFIILMSLIVVYGANIKSLAAGIGCFGGILLSSVLTVSMGKVFLITGLTDDDAVYLRLLNPDRPIDLKAIIFASVIIGALGAVMDVSVSMASSLTEVKEASQDTSFKSLFKSGLSIGRDIMGANANTLILAYIGSSLSVVLLLIANNKNLLSVLNREMIVCEILQSLIGSFAILLTIPLTSLVCAFFYSERTKKST